MSGKAQLKHLRCLQSHMYTLCNDGAALDVCLEWLLEETPTLEALSLLQKSVDLAAISLQHLKHLQVEAHVIQGANVEIAEQMLETLHICGLIPVISFDEIDVSGCQQLRQLVFKGALVQRLQRDLLCMVHTDLHHVFLDYLVL